LRKVSEKLNGPLFETMTRSLISRMPPNRHYNTVSFNLLSQKGDPLHFALL
jgi:hypothetical protein